MATERPPSEKRLIIIVWFGLIMTLLSLLGVGSAMIRHNFELTVEPWYVSTLLIVFAPLVALLVLKAERYGWDAPVLVWGRKL